MTNLTKPWSVVLVPRPLTAFAAFAWYAISELLPVGGLVREKRFFRWINATHPRGTLQSPHGVILNLNAEKAVFETELLRWLKSPLAGVPNRRWAIEPGFVSPFPEITSKESIALRDFFSQGNRWKSWLSWESWFISLSQTQNPQVALEISSGFLRNLVEKEIDPRRTKIIFPHFLQVPASVALPNIPSIVNVTMPVVKKRGPIDAKNRHRKAIDYSIKSLPEKNIFRLVGQHVLIAVGGPSGSGKSTLVPSLLIEMRNIINSLRSRGGEWNQLNLAVEISSLDAATPVADSVILSKAGSRKNMRALKREWNLDLAQEAVAESKTKLATANIVLADLPGKLTDITESLSAFVTFGGIVTNDWPLARKEWRAYFEHIKAPILFQVKSSRASSLVTTYKPGKEILGRINQLDRVVRGWDPFVRTLAEFLLFDILPSRLHRPENRPIDVHKHEDECITVRFD